MNDDCCRPVSLRGAEWYGRGGTIWTTDRSCCCCGCGVLALARWSISYCDIRGCWFVPETGLFVAGLKLCVKGRLTSSLSNSWYCRLCGSVPGRCWFCWLVEVGAGRTVSPGAASPARPRLDGRDDISFCLNKTRWL